MITHNDFNRAIRVLSFAAVNRCRDIVGLPLLKWTGPPVSGSVKRKPKKTKPVK